LEIAPDEQRALRPFIKAKASADDSIIDTWLAQRGINKHLAMEATSAWSLFKDLVKNKPLKHCTRNDGRMLVKALLDSGNKTQTVAKKVGHLRAAVNLAIDDGKLLFNPFRNVTPPITDELVRIPLSREDMVLVNAHVHELRLSDQLLWKWLASTGMRLEEPFQVREEFEEDGIRYIVIGTKTDQSKRRVPLPDCVMAMLPDRIMGPVFQDSAETAAKRIRYFLRRLGISHDRRKGTGDPRKVIHSLRHRAADRLRAVRCPLEIQHQILGHEVKTVASGYGHGHPVATLKEWIDKISY
jgi:integrase